MTHKPTRAVVVGPRGAAIGRDVVQMGAQDHQLVGVAGAVELADEVGSVVSAVGVLEAVEAEVADPLMNPVHGVLQAVGLAEGVGAAGELWSMIAGWGEWRWG